MQLASAIIRHTHTHTHTLTHYLQFVEIEVVYPGWAQFIGAVIILTAVLPMPIVLIVRLILYKTAREEAVDFLKKLRADAERTYRLFINCRSVAIYRCYRNFNCGY